MPKAYGCSLPCFGNVNNLFVFKKLTWLTWPTGYVAPAHLIIVVINNCLQISALIAMSIVHLPPLFLVISPILVRWPFPVRSRQRMRGQPRMHGRLRIAWSVGGVNLPSLAQLHFCFGACPVHTYGAVIVDLFYLNFDCDTQRNSGSLCYVRMLWIP